MPARSKAGDLSARRAWHRQLDQIAAYEELLPEERNLFAGGGSAVQITANMIHSSTIRGLAPRSGLSPQSRKFFGLLKEKDKFGYDEAVDMANRAGIQIDKSAMRPRVHQYLQSGYVERIENGVFRLSEKGRAVAET